MNTDSKKSGLSVPKYISITAACARYGCKKTKLYELLRAKRIAAVKLGTRTLVVVASGDAFFASLPAF